MRLLVSRVLLPLLVLTAAAVPARANCPQHPADVAPGILGSEVPVPVWTVLGNGAIDVQDVLVALNAVVGNYSLAWQAPAEPGCLALPGNLSPGAEDDGFDPPRWTPAPNSELDVGDVLVILRFAVGIIELDPDWIEPIVADAGVGDRVVAGSVIDSITSSGLPGVVVTAVLSDEPVGETETDAAGEFLLQGLPSGTLTLRLDGSGSSAVGKFSTLEVQIEVDTQATTSVNPITLADETDPDGASGKFGSDETGTLDESVELTSGDGDVGLSTGPGGKITDQDGMPIDDGGEVDLSVVPVEGEDLPGELEDESTGETLNSTGEVAVGPADGKFSAGGSGAGLSAAGTDPGFDLILPNRHDLTVGTMVDIWHWNGAGWTNCTTETGRAGTVVDLGGGMTAVSAPGVVTQGGLYAAAVPIDLSCTSTLDGLVTDQNDNPLQGVLVTTSLGAAGITDEFGGFFLFDLPAYSGLDVGTCAGLGYEVFVRAGVELGSVSTSRTVQTGDVVPGGSVSLGQLTLTIPDEGCLSGLVLKNGVPQPGPVTITGPDPLVPTADDEGRFAATGLTPGSYRASFQFAGEPQPREFDFEIEARLCTAIRLEVVEGGGSSRLVVHVIYDDDEESFTPNPPAEGAIVQVFGTDAVSENGLQGITGPNGRIAFDGVDGPFDIVAMLERPMPATLSGGRSGHDGPEPYMRIGAGLVTPAPLGVATMYLQLPPSVDEPEQFPDGQVTGAAANLPMPAVGEFLVASPLRPFRWDEPWFGFADPLTGDYAADGYLSPFWLSLGLADENWPHLLSELSVLPDPLQLMPGLDPWEPAFLDLDVNYEDGFFFEFNQLLELTYTNYLTSAGFKDIAFSAARPDGLGFYTLRFVGGESTPLPASVMVADPASVEGQGFHPLLELYSEPFDAILGSQGCIVPLNAPLPPTLNVDFLIPPDVNGPDGQYQTVEDLTNGPIDFDVGFNQVARGFNAIQWLSTYDPPLADGLATSSFIRYQGPVTLDSAVLGPTPAPFVYPDQTVMIGIQGLRGQALPAAHTDFFGPSFESILAGLPFQDDPVCDASDAAVYWTSEPPP